MNWISISFHNIWFFFLPNVKGKMRGAVRHYQEPEYQQPYAYPPSHAIPYNPAGSTTFAGYNPGGTPTSDHASEMTFTESELALTHQATLPICNGRFHFPYFLFYSNFLIKNRRCSIWTLLKLHQAVRGIFFFWNFIQSFWYFQNRN